MVFGADFQRPIDHFRQMLEIRSVLTQDKWIKIVTDISHTTCLNHYDGQM